jgi:hypothetical protein
LGSEREKNYWAQQFYDSRRSSGRERRWVGRSGGEYGCTHGDGVGGLGHLGAMFSKTGGNKKRRLTITANNIHGNRKEIKRASQTPEGDRKKVKTKARPPSSQ